MLYDPKWEREEKMAYLFKLETFVAWLESKPRDQSYKYACTGTCLLARYAQDNGFPQAVMGFLRWFPDGLDAPNSRLPAPFDNIAVSKPHTFGGALDRARLALTGRG